MKYLKIKNTITEFEEYLDFIKSYTPVYFKEKFNILDEVDLKLLAKDIAHSLHYKKSTIVYCKNDRDLDRLKKYIADNDLIKIKRNGNSYYKVEGRINYHNRIFFTNKVIESIGASYDQVVLIDIEEEHLQYFMAEILARTTGSITYKLV